MERKKTKNSQVNTKTLLDQALKSAEEQGYEIQIVYKDGSDLENSLLAFNKIGRVLHIDETFLTFSFIDNNDILEYILLKRNICSALVKPKIKSLLK